MRALAVVALLAWPVAAQEFPFSEGEGRALLDTCRVEAGNRATCADRVATACMEREPRVTQTTFGMMRCFQIMHRAWDVLLNTEYRAALAAMERQDAADAEFRAPGRRADGLCAAQRAWIAYRDAQCGFSSASWGNGSMRRIAGAECLATMTSARTLYLMIVQERP